MADDQDPYPSQKLLRSRYSLVATNNFVAGQGATGDGSPTDKSLKNATLTFAIKTSDTIDRSPTVSKRRGSVQARRSTQGTPSGPTSAPAAVEEEEEVEEEGLAGKADIARITHHHERVAAPLLKAKGRASARSRKGGRKHIAPQQESATVKTGSVAEPNLSMSSQRNRNGRGGVRGGAIDGVAEQVLWSELRETLPNLGEMMANSQRTADQIAEMMSSLEAKEERGEAPTLQEQDALQALYRKNIKEAEEIKAFAEGDDAIPKLRILKALVQANEEQTPSRGSGTRDFHSRGLDMDGARDTPERPLDHKQSRKLHQIRTSSQPPKDKDAQRKEQSEERESHTASSSRLNTKISFALGAQVAFKPKIQGQVEEHEWIQGIVAKVIGEGKSRRYDVQDPYPEQGKTGLVYRSSASSMVPIPPMGSPLPEYELGKRVLALYPETTTFYRAEVRAMVDEGTKVKLLFEDDGQGVYKEVERRFVLDHKG